MNTDPAESRSEEQRWIESAGHTEAIVRVRFVAMQGSDPVEGIVEKVVLGEESYYRGGTVTVLYDDTSYVLPLWAVTPVGGPDLRGMADG